MSANSNVQTIRKLLESYPDGLTPGQIQNITGIRNSNAYNAMKRQKDVYVDRWAPDTDSLRWAPVFVLVPRPEDAPKPDMKVSEFIKATA